MCVQKVACKTIEVTKPPIEIGEPFRPITVEIQVPKHLFKVHMVAVPVDNKPDALDENARNVQANLIFLSRPRKRCVPICIPGGSHGAGA